MTLETGDHVRAVGLLVNHHGIIDRRGGPVRVVHSSARLGGVVETSLEEFAGRRRVELVFRPESGQGAAVADRARRRLGEAWHPTRANCEHLAFGACGRAASPQLEDSWLPGVVAGLVSGLVVVGGIVAASVLSRMPRLRPVRMECADSELGPLVRELSGSVVALRIRGPSGRALGSGVVVADGLVVTNEHVVRGAVEVEAAAFGAEPVRGSVVAADPALDLALVRLPLTGRPLRLAQNVEVGERVLALGAPYGLELTVTVGVVSGVHRGNLDHARDVDFLQADVAIAPGSSGGALLNFCGELVGITTAASASGFAFCVPARQVAGFLSQHPAVLPATQWLRNETRVRIYHRDTPPGQRSPACVYCGRAVTVGRLPSDSEAGQAAAVIDHVFPHARPELRNDLRNLVTACWSCNASKGDRSPPEWEDYREDMGLPRLPRWRSRRPEPPGPLLARAAEAVQRPLCDDSEPACAAALEDLERRRTANAEAQRRQRR